MAPDEFAVDNDGVRISELTNGQYALVYFSRHSGSDELFVTSITLTVSPFN